MLFQFFLSLLHIAVVNQKVDLVTKILDLEEDVVRALVNTKNFLGQVISL